MTEKCLPKDRGWLAWYTLVYLMYIMCLSYVHSQIIIIQCLYLKSSFWCALLLMEIMSTRSATTGANKLFCFSANLSLELTTISTCPRAHNSHGCWVSFTPVFIRFHCKVPHFCFHLLIIVSCNTQPSLPSLLSAILLNSNTECSGMLPLKSTVLQGILQEGEMTLGFWNFMLCLNHISASYLQLLCNC